MKDISVVIPAFNEEHNITAAIDSVTRALQGAVDDYEIIVVNDGSRDKTGVVAEEFARRDPQVRVLHNERNSGYGFTLRRGISAATKTYITGFPGDNDTDGDSFRAMMQEIGQADAIISYMLNPQKRSLWRMFLSKTFVLILNTLFGLRIRYYNGLFIFKRSIFQSLEVKSTGFAVIAESIVRMLKTGCSYKEVGFYHVPRQTGKSTAVSFKNLLRVIKTVAVLYKDIYFSPKSCLKREPCSIS